MKLGILGTGMIVQDFLQTVHTLDLTSLAILGRESSREKTQALAAAYSIDACFYDYDAMLRSDLDTIYVALPNHLHYAYARKALDAGKRADGGENR